MRGGWRTEPAPQVCVSEPLVPGHCELFESQKADCVIGVLRR